MILSGASDRGAAEADIPVCEKIVDTYNTTGEKYSEAQSEYDQAEKNYKEAIKIKKKNKYKMKIIKVSNFKDAVNYLKK